MKAMKAAIAAIALLSLLVMCSAQGRGTRCTGGPQGNNVCSTDNGNGTTTFCIKATNNCFTVPNGRRKLLDTETSELISSHGRALTQYVYTGCSKGDWGSVCTVNNNNGTSSTCTVTKYYSGCSTYPNSQGRKLLATEDGLISSYGRALLQAAPYTGCSKGDWGSVCTIDNKNGTSSTCTTTKYYTGCSTYPNGRKLLSSEDELDAIDETITNHGRVLNQASRCSSGKWGSVCTTDYGNGTSSTCTKTPYYNGCSYYPTG